ncbi:MAG: hypothetical protein ABJA70_23085 [Chryseolinea sp.]
MIAEHFQKAIADKGHATNIEGNQLTIPSVGMVLKFEELKTVHGIGFIGVDVHHPSLLPNGFKEVAIGTGSDDVIRTKAAVHSWMFTDYPVLYAYMSPAKVDMGVHRMSVVSQHDNEVLGLEVFYRSAVYPWICVKSRERFGTRNVSCTLRRYTGTPYISGSDRYEILNLGRSGGRGQS